MLLTDIYKDRATKIYLGYPKPFSRMQEHGPRPQISTFLVGTDIMTCCMVRPAITHERICPYKSGSINGSKIGKQAVITVAARRINVSNDLGELQVLADAKLQRDPSFESPFGSESFVVVHCSHPLDGKTAPYSLSTFKWIGNSWANFASSISSLG